MVHSLYLMASYPKSTLQIQFKSIQTKSQKINFIFIEVSKLERKCTKTFKMGLERFGGRGEGMLLLSAFLQEKGIPFRIFLNLDSSLFLILHFLPLSKSCWDSSHFSNLLAVPHTWSALFSMATP